MNRVSRKSSLAEAVRLRESNEREANWQRWGPYLAERQWGTVREDYSHDGQCWYYFPFDQAMSRAYRWGEDGLLGICDRQCRLCFALALWNGQDEILKERLFGLTGPEGNHGEDVKECYYYLDSTPTHSYMKALYKYPQRAFPYACLREENRRRNRDEAEFELEDTGIFDEGRYFDVVAEYTKAGPDNLLIRITAANRGPEAAELHLLPTLWFRNNWSWGCTHEGCEVKPYLGLDDQGGVVARHSSLGAFRLVMETGPDRQPDLLFTDNETNKERLFGAPNDSPYVKDAFNRYLVHGDVNAVNPRHFGTKAAAHYVLNIPAGGQATLRLRLAAEEELPAGVAAAFGQAFDEVFARREQEADEFHVATHPEVAALSPDQGRVVRQAFAGLMWSKQFYHYVIRDWLTGDPNEPVPPANRWDGRNNDWPHLFNRDIVAMPDKWEYPWYAAWDLAFHAVALAHVDSEFAKSQLELFLREWYMHPNGQIPAYEFNFSDVNPPVHAWACWRVYKMTGPKGGRDRQFLARVFTKLLLNFTWWVNRKDVEGKHLFSGGFLGLDNIGVFDRSRPLPTGGHLNQADGTAWMAFYCTTMLAMAIELAQYDSTYEDIASKFFEHFVHIVDAINCLGGIGLWDDRDGFYYDQLHTEGQTHALRVRSMVGIAPLFAVEVLDDELIERLPGFKKRMDWFLKHRADLGRHISYMDPSRNGREHGYRLLAIPSRERLERVLKYLLDESEFLSPHGIRALSRVYKDQPYEFWAGGEAHRVEYVPGESNTCLFGGNSNWRGPVWLPVNYLIIEALERYHHFYGGELTVEFPNGSGRRLDLKQVARELSRRLAGIFERDEQGRRPCHGGESRYVDDPHWRDLVLFHEYFHGDDGRGLGASHQTGWTALVAPLLLDLAREEKGGEPKKVATRKRKSGRAAGVAGKS